MPGAVKHGVAAPPREGADCSSTACGDYRKHHGGSMRAVMPRRNMIFEASKLVKYVIMMLKVYMYCIEPNDDDGAKDKYAIFNTRANGE